MISILKNWFLVAIVFLFLVSAVVYSILIDRIKNTNISEYLSNTKTTNQIYLIIDFTFITIINLILANILFSSHIKNGLYSIEKRSGVKIREIFLVRYFVICLFSLFVISFLLCFKLIGLISINPDRSYVTVDKIMFSYLANIIFNILIINLLVIGFFLFNRVITMILILLFVSSNVISPIIFNISFTGSIANSVKLTNARDLASSNAKLNIGKSFSDFIDDNQEYEFLRNDFSSLDIRLDEGSAQKSWQLYERIFYFGDIRNEGIYDQLKINLDNNLSTDPESNIYKMLEGISKANEQIEQNNNINDWNKLMFNKPNHSFLEPNNYLNKLISLNIENGKYNKLFKYFLNEFDNFFLINEMINSTAWSAIRTTGSIFEYGLFDTDGEVSLNQFRRDYVDPGEVTFYWLLFQTLRYSLTIDSKQIRTFYREQPSYDTYMMFNMFNYLPFIANGNSINNRIFDDIYAVNGLSFVQTPRFSYDLNVGKEFEQYKSNTGKAKDIRIDRAYRVSENELKAIKVGKLQASTNYILVVLFEVLISIILSLVGYFNYKRIWK
ncbi:hypothetical protein [Spiroplasma sp. TIUS-1]|uniref:hypothetical protein n=1 Tax=Spiroplasma sp. TIUS-1 TaxID=216963 RepID=UPI0013A69AC9|nr:hypothetical protein [Spiroplasma sp. TIUS-1]